VGRLNGGRVLRWGIWWALRDGIAIQLVDSEQICGRK
jgi:hypothetical protein